MSHRKNKVTYKQQVAMGLVQAPQKGFRSAADLGLPTEQPARPATITAIEPARPAPLAAQQSNALDWSKSDQPYRATRNEHKDIAEGFRYVAMPVSIAASISVPVTAWVGLGVPVFSLITIALMVTTFTVAYFGCWILSQFFSHHGVNLAKVLLGYRLLRHDQRERHRHYRGLSR